jgi:hypothetical protein
LRTLFCIHGERLLAHDVFARAHQNCSLLCMQVIWSADVYDINLLVFSKLVEGRVSAINTQSASRLRSAISRTTRALLRRGFLVYAAIQCELDRQSQRR